MTIATENPVPSPDPVPAKPWWIRIFSQPSTSILVATVAVSLVVGLVHPEFLNPDQLLDILQQATFVALIAAGMAYLIAMREIDLSVGSVFALSLMVAAFFVSNGANPWLALPIGVIAGMLLGVANAAIIQVLAIPGIVATLATMSIFRGLATGMTGDSGYITDLPLDHSFFTIVGGSIGPIPTSILITALVLIPVGLALHHTPFGYRVRAVGSNPEAATAAGISIPKVRLQVFALLGGLCGLAGVLALAFFTTGDPHLGGDFSLTAIAAAVIGGTQLRGGNGSVLGAAAGAVLLKIIVVSLTYFKVPANWTEFFTGSAILLAVAIDSIVQLIKRHRAKQQVGA